MSGSVRFGFDRRTAHLIFVKCREIGKILLSSLFKAFIATMYDRDPGRGSIWSGEYAANDPERKLIVLPSTPSVSEGRDGIGIECLNRADR